MGQVESYIESVPEPFSSLAALVRELILETVYGVTEKFSYQMPVYHYYGLFAFIIYKKEGWLDVSFMRGKDLCEMFPQLELRDRATAASLVLREPGDIGRLQLPAIIVTAAAWQVEAKMLGIPLMNNHQKQAQAKTAGKPGG